MECIVALIIIAWFWWIFSKLYNVYILDAVMNAIFENIEDGNVKNVIAYIDVDVFATSSSMEWHILSFKDWRDAWNERYRDLPIFTHRWPNYFNLQRKS